MEISDDDMKKIINGDVGLLVEKAEALGRSLAGETTTTQIRRLFSTFRQIEMSWPYTNEPEEQEQLDSAYRELILFGPRIEYQTQKHAGLRSLAKAIKSGIRQVDKTNRKTIQHLAEFFEAVVAYAIVETEKQAQARSNHPQNSSQGQRK